jgi:hypothetical protein
MTIFDYAEKWMKRSNAGDSQASIAKAENVSEPYISRMLKFARLPNQETNTYRTMLQKGEIIEGAILDLVDKGDTPDERRKVLDRAVRYCQARDIAAERARKSGKKGRFRTAPKPRWFSWRAAALNQPLARAADLLSHDQNSYP